MEVDRQTENKFLYRQYHLICVSFIELFRKRKGKERKGWSQDKGFKSQMLFSYKFLDHPIPKTHFQVLS